MSGSIIDVDRMKKISSGFIDPQENETTIEEAYKEIHDWCGEQMQGDERNTCKDHAYPFLASMTTEIVRKIFGDEGAAVILASNPFVRVLMVHSIMAGFYSYHMMNQRNFQFNTVEEEITEQQLHDIQMAQGIVEATLTAIMAGQDPGEVFRYLYKSGQLTDEDVENYGLEELVADVEQDEPEPSN